MPAITFPARFLQAAAWAVPASPLLTARAACFPARPCAFAARRVRRTCSSSPPSSRSPPPCAMSTRCSRHQRLHVHDERVEPEGAPEHTPQPSHAVLAGVQLRTLACLARAWLAALCFSLKKCAARTHTRLTTPRCSPAPSEVAGRFVLADEEGPMRWRRHQIALARSCSDMVVVAVCADSARMRAAGATAACDGTVRAQRVSGRSAHPMDPTGARGGIVRSLKRCPF